MCLIRVRREVGDEEVISPRLANGGVRGGQATTTVITPIPPAPPPPPPEPTYSTALVPTTHQQSNYVYDVGSERLIEAQYDRHDRYDYDGHRHRDYRASDSDYIYAGNSVSGGGGGGVATTTIIKGGVVRSRSTASDRRSRSHSRARSYSGAISGSKDTKIVIGPGGDAYVQTHRHRHRRRSGSLEREKSVTRFSHVNSAKGAAIVSSTGGGRRSHVSISNGRMSDVEMFEPRSSFRYIEPRGSAPRGLESADMVRRRENERFAYGGVGEQRRNASVSYVHADSSHRRSFSGGGGRRSRDKVLMVDSRDYY